MGGCAVILFGDLLQLKPIDSRFFFEEPSHVNHRELFKKYSIIDTFRIISLQQNHRQEKDIPFQNLLNELRFKDKASSLSTENLNLLLSRVRPLPQNVNCCKIFARNETCKNENEKCLRQISERQFTNIACFIPSTYSPKIKKGDLIDDTPFVNTLNIKKKARIILKYNIDISDRLVNGSQGVVEDIITDGSQIKLILIKFDDTRSGKQYRKKFLHIDAVKKRSDLVPIFKLEFNYQNSRIKNQKIVLIQFPIKLAFCITVHAAQGMTIPYPTLLQTDFSDVFEGGMAYIVLSRIQCIEQLFLKPFHPKKLFCNAKAKDFVQKITHLVSEKIINLWMREHNMKFASLNCRSLKSHCQDIFELGIIQQANFILVQETWLPPDFKVHLPVKFNAVYLYAGARGIATFYDAKISPLDIVKLCTDEANYIIFIYFQFILVNVYQFAGNSNVKSFQNIIEMLAKYEVPIIVAGDLNINLLDKRNNFWLSNVKMLNQIVKNPTTIYGTLLDHIYLSKDLSLKFIHQDFMYFSDHCLNVFAVENI